MAKFMFKDSITALNQQIDRLEEVDGADKNELKELTKQVSMMDDADLPLDHLQVRTSLMKVLEVVIELHESVEKLSGVDHSSHPTMTMRIKKAVSRSSQPSEKIKEIKDILKSVVATIPPPQGNEPQPQPKWNVEKEGAVGREEEEKKIIQQLITINNANVPNSIIVLPIVGIKGLGKTALARHIFHKLANNPFELMLWVETGESFHVGSTVNSIIQQVRAQSDPAQHDDDDDRIQDRLQEAIGENKRYLLVLDDVKRVDPNEWHKFKTILPSGGSILITTPSPLVAKITATAPPLALRGLSQRDSWSLFKLIVSSSVDENETNSTNEKQRKMVEACKGVPFAIQILGWLWDTNSLASQTDVEHKFLQQLELKYYRELPFPLKLCFAFCSLFPTNDVINVARLISLWMGERFVLPRFSSDDNSLQYEAIGEEYFQLLYETSIFEQVQEDELGNPIPTSCRMHPLMHYLAVFVAKDEYISVRPDGKGITESVCHASFDFSLDVSSVIPESIFDVKSLLTIFLPAEKQSRLQNIMKMSYSTCKKVFTRFKTLHVLDLHDLGIHTVHKSIGNLEELRYLDLSKNNMDALPNSITKLKHLHTLKLSHCRQLKDLPKDLDDLTKLRNLDLEGCLDLTHMPECIKRMTSLRSLSLFMAGHRKNTGLRGLGSLNKLRGVLEISHLERCDASDAEKAKLDQKNHLQRLILRWDHDDADTVDDDEFLKCLKLPQQLKALLLIGYGGETLSHWQSSISSLQCLVKFSLINCRQCKSLLPLHHLPSLHILELRKLNSLEFIVENKDEISCATDQYFPSLKKLIISDCPVLTSWWKDKIPEESTIPTFSSISILDIQYCPNLRHMPLCVDLDEKLVVISSSVKPVLNNIQKPSPPNPFSKLKSMMIANINHDAPPEDLLVKFISLRRLHIRECHRLRRLPQGFHKLEWLEDLIIENCKEIAIKDSSSTSHEDEGWKDLKNLRSLTIKRIPKLKCLPKGLECVKSLEELHLHDCSNLICLLENMEKLKSLKTLEITECVNLGCLPQSLKSLNSLDTLIIKDCPKLVPRCQPNTGDDWPQIQHIPNKSIWQTSKHRL